MPTRYTIALVSLLAASATAAPLSAESLDPSPEHCIYIASDLERLACYDAFYERKAASTRRADEIARRAAAQQLAEAAALQPDNVGNADTTRARISHWLASFRGGDSSEVVPLEDPVAALANAGRGSLLDRRWELAKDSKFGEFNLRSYKPVYALPIFWTNKTNPLPTSGNPNNTVTDWHNVQPVEGKFQLSFKTKIVENIFGDTGDLWGAYTQTSRWQMFNSVESRPFRETNYEPELMLVFRNRYHLGEWSGRMAAIGINHQSNGQDDPQSRSWNRIVGTVGLDRDNWALVIRPWWRIPEGKREDNNPHIEDYMGRADAMLVWRNGEHEVSTLVRHSLRSGDRARGALQVDWAFPLGGPLRGRVQLFSGYGESLIDYNHKSTYVGLGISLLEWF